MSNMKVENPADMLSVGEVVWCKVISIDVSNPINRLLEHVIKSLICEVY